MLGYHGAEKGWPTVQNLIRAPTLLSLDATNRYGAVVVLLPG